MIRRRLARRGVGVLLTLVITLALVLFVAGIAQLFSSGQVYRQTARGSGGLTAEYIARSAVAELFFQVQKAATDPAKPLFKRLREVLLTGEQSDAPDGLIDFSKEFDTPDLTDQLERSDHKAFYKNFKIEKLSVRAGIDRTRPIYTNQVLRLAATVTLSLGGATVVRRVEETRQIGILLTAPKRPLDQATFLVLDNPFIPDFRTACLGVKQMAELYRQIQAWLVAWKQQIESKPPGAELAFDMAMPGGAPGQPPRNVRVMLTGEIYQFDGLWPALAGDPNLIQPPPEKGYLIAGQNESIDLAAYDHETHMSDDVDRAIKRIPDLAARVDRVMETFASASGRPFTAGEHYAWATQIGQLGQDMHGVLEILVREVGRISVEMAPHVKVLPGLANFSLDQQGRLGPPLYPIAYHISTQLELEALFKKHPRLNAHIAYQGDVPLKINFVPISGRMVISSAKAPIEVTNLVSGSKDEDVFVLAAPDVVFKGGRIDAGVIVRGNAKFSNGATSIVGNLVLEKLPRRRDRSADQDLKGRVTYYPGLYSGLLKPPRDAKKAKLTSYAVGFSTVPQDVDISWKP